MQHAETPGNPGEPVGLDLRKQSHRRGSYQKVLDARKRPVRGLWVRNGRYYARVALPHPGTDATQVRRVPLEGTTTVAAAQAALRRLLTQREDQALPRAAADSQVQGLRRGLLCPLR